MIHAGSIWTVSGSGTFGAAGGNQMIRAARRHHRYALWWLLVTLGGWLA